MSQDIVEKLRVQAANLNAASLGGHDGNLLNEAADEIERLRRTTARMLSNHTWHRGRDRS